MSFPSLISQKPGEIPIFRTFLAKFSILAYISLKIGYFELGHDYDVTVTSYLGCWYLFWYVWKEETPSYTMVPIRCILGVSFSSSKGVVTTPLGKTCYKKRLGRGLTNKKEIKTKQKQGVKEKNKRNKTKRHHFSVLKPLLFGKKGPILLIIIIIVNGYTKIKMIES